MAARDARGVGAQQVERSAIYISEHAHHCVAKAIRIAGLREAALRLVPMDERYRMDVPSLERMI